MLVHSSLRSLGWVCGGATAVVLALRDVLGSAGTIVVPAHTAEHRDPKVWSPPVPAEFWPVIREHLPGFDPLLSPTCLGAIPERVRTWPGAVRSDHPQTSFAAIGPRAADLMSGHALDCQLGERSPLGRLSGQGAQILLLGVDFSSCTAFHLAEYRLPHSVDCGCRRVFRTIVDGPDGPQWVTYEDIDLDAEGFGELGNAWAATSPSVTSGRIGGATARLFPFDDAVLAAFRVLQGQRNCHLQGTKDIGSE
ncbi:aminoglycoside N(3)-acetyltransferase [Hamadaea tsunoensis]|uniref:aminoglycoside N(3)-acetyltransferase n=1 Tax=Hamadaea tsunoensis TaxID=53368 RepID=UPI001B7FB605|nr:AAC(3) family N-acetyltransferase [Hamadaea tsunoensis]